MHKILLFAGTTEGRLLAEEMSSWQAELFVCVATEYGSQLIPRSDNIIVLTGRLNIQQMCECMNENKFDCVVDATHPYAAAVTKNIMQASQETHTKYFRLLRESSAMEHCISVPNTQEAVNYLNQTYGNVLLTTGSKELELFTKVDNYKQRLYARVLPTQEVLRKCDELGFEGSHLMAMQGPFSKEMNLALLKQWDIRTMVTKESGDAGGFLNKFHAAELAGAQTVVIGRPIEQAGYRYKELAELLRGQYSGNENG